MMLASFSLAGVSQTGIHKGVLGTPELRKTGLVIRPEVGYGIIDREVVPFAANVGYQVSPCLYVGAGCGVFTGREWFVPVYSSVRWCWFRGPYSPYLELNLGLSYGNYYRGYYYNYGYNVGYQDGYHAGYNDGYNDGYYQGSYDPYYGDPYYNDSYDYYEYRHYSELMAYGQIAIGCDIKRFDVKVALPVFLGSYPYAGLFVSLGYNFMPQK